MATCQSEVHIVWGTASTRCHNSGRLSKGSSKVVFEAHYQSRSKDREQGSLYTEILTVQSFEHAWGSRQTFPWTAYTLAYSAKIPYEPYVKGEKQRNTKLFAHRPIDHLSCCDNNVIKVMGSFRLSVNRKCRQPVSHKVIGPPTMSSTCSLSIYLSDIKLLKGSCRSQKELLCVKYFGCTMSC